MSRHRTPLSKARLTGADRKNPQRYRDRAEPTLSSRPLGDAPSYLPPRARAAWRAFEAELGWLAHEDRPIIEVAATLRAKIAESGPATTTAMLAAYKGTLASLGATPTDRSRICAHRAEPEDNPFAAFSAGPAG